MSIFGLYFSKIFPSSTFVIFESFEKRLGIRKTRKRNFNQLDAKESCSTKFEILSSSLVFSYKEPFNFPSLTGLSTMKRVQAPFPKKAPNFNPICVQRLEHATDLTKISIWPQRASTTSVNEGYF